jgi:hypothetical protein
LHATIDEPGREGGGGIAHLTTFAVLGTLAAGHYCLRNLRDGHPSRRTRATAPERRRPSDGARPRRPTQAPTEPHGPTPTAGAVMTRHAAAPPNRWRDSGWFPPSRRACAPRRRGQERAGGAKQSEFGPARRWTCPGRAWRQGGGLDHAVDDADESDRGERRRGCSPRSACALLSAVTPGPSSPSTVDRSGGRDGSVGARDRDRAPRRRRDLRDARP